VSMVPFPKGDILQYYPWLIQAWQGFKMRLPWVLSF
jgi:hypothetical protein